ncbi:MAG TPA: hypothetical protein DDX92_09370 [Flavobacteriales bacterium]|jgi:hypothetical protein|nr:hypothetical protein [Flavobacteriales bacterium]
MLDILFKKKISEEKLAEFFVYSTFKIVDEGFGSVVDIVEAEPEFILKPEMDRTNVDGFLWIVIAGNLKFIPRFFNDYQDIRLLNHAMRQFSIQLELPIDEFKDEVRKMQQFMSKVNHPSKNTLYAMSKAFFYVYQLNRYQDDYFKKMKSPNPLFIKRLDEIMESFLFDWEEFIQKYRIVE